MVGLGSVSLHGSLGGPLRLGGACVRIVRQPRSQLDLVGLSGLARRPPPHPHARVPTTCDGEASCRAAERLVVKVENMFAEALRADKLTPGTASKLRGVLGFLARELWGRVARGGMKPLIQREFLDAPPWNLSLALMRSFEFHTSLLQMGADREMKLGRSSLAPIVVASDGMFDERLGGRIASLFADRDKRWGYCSALPQDLLDQWDYKINPIQKIEGFAVFHGLITAWDDIVGRDLVWFIDNSSALAATVKGSTKDVDLDIMVQTIYFLAFAGRVRIWWE